MIRMWVGCPSFMKVLSPIQLLLLIFYIFPIYELLYFLQTCSQTSETTIHLHFDREKKSIAAYARVHHLQDDVLSMFIICGDFSH